ncbi:carbohydrate-binding domain-containing protein, partial [Alloprevotella tannerae]|uniref:carbohydrate-binding domain-containing protein n=1 Tax=Alloprevotella tannerae TaxID=76122 RepID=UPI0028EA6B9C
QVTSDNCGDLSVIDGVEGTVKYDPDSKTLTLEGATINSTTTNAIVLYRGDLTIKVIGTNSLTTTDNATLSFKSPLTLTGGGTLNVKSQTDCAVYANGTNLTINNCTVNAESGAYGIAGNSGSNEKLLIKNATVTAEGKEGSICDFKEITLEGCAITQPAGARFDEAKHAIVLNGEKVTSEVKIEPIVTKYDLKICGTQVTSDNCGDLSVIDGVEGTVKYDPDSKTLTLEGAKLNAGSCIESDIDGLTIKVSSTNKLNAADAAIAVYAPTTITGGGTLYAESRNNCGIFNDIYLTIKDCIVNAKGYWGIAGQDGSKGTLLISNATVTAEGEKYGSICDFKEITLEDCAITQPAGAEFDESKKAVVLNGEVVTSEVKIVQTKYDLWINDTQVTSDNCGDLSGIDGVEGTVKYDPDSKTLTLEGAKLNVRSSCIGSKIDGLTIKVSGTNELNAEILAAVAVSAPATITGGGTLNVKSEEYATICAYNETDLTIKDCIVNAKGKWGIAGDEGSTETLLISNATVRVEGENGSICSLKEITLEDCAITQPAGAVFDESKHAVVLNGEVVTSKVVIEPVTEYGLKICGTWVTSANCDDLTVIDGVEGTVKYEPESKTLTLENATIKNTNKEDYSSIGLYNAIDGLAIRLIGNNTISVEYNSGIGNRDGNALTLTGNGKLTVKSLAETSRYSIFNEGTITVRNCTLEASGWVGGLNRGYWKFDHCTVHVKGGGDSEYEDLGSINRLSQKPEFIGCAVIAPAGTYWKEGEDIVGEPYYSLFGADDKVVTDWVTIADPTSIHTPIVDTNTKQGIYTISGVKLSGEIEDLPKGIYIVNGKKVVKK